MDSPGSGPNSWNHVDSPHLFGENTSVWSSVLPLDDISELTYQSMCEFESRSSAIPILDPCATENHLKDTSPFGSKIILMGDVLETIEKARKRHRGISLKGNVASKFLDCLKKKPIKMCRNLLRKAVAGILPSKFRYFALLNEDKQVLEQILNCEYWPTGEWPVDPTRKYKSFSYQCICDLLTEGDFKKLYDEVIDWYFNNNSLAELEKFLGLPGITLEETRIFHVFFTELMREKCKAATI